MIAPLLAFILIFPSALSKQQYESGFSAGGKKAVQEKDQGEVRPTSTFKILLLIIRTPETQAG